MPSPTSPGITPVEIPYEDTVLHGYFYRAAGDGSKLTLVMRSRIRRRRRRVALLRRRRRTGTRLPRPDLRRPRPARGHPPGRADLPAVLGERGRPRGRTYSPGSRASTRPASHCSASVLTATWRLARRAYERRPAAVIVLDGVFDAACALTARLPLPHNEVIRRAAAEDDGELDQIIADARAQSPAPRWACEHGRYVTGTSTDRAFPAEYARYNSGDGSAEKITSPRPGVRGGRRRVQLLRPAVGSAQAVPAPESTGDSPWPRVIGGDSWPNRFRPCGPVASRARRRPSRRRPSRRRSAGRGAAAVPEPTAG